MKNKNLKPPLFAVWLLRRFSLEKNRDSLLDDLEFEYRELLSEKGRFFAKFWYISHLFRAIPELLISLLLWRFIMFKNYLKIALRHIKRQKGYSFINIFGLAVGMTCCILILLYIQFELSYDKYHENADRIYRLAVKGKMGGETLNIPKSSHPMAETLYRDFPEVQNVVKLSRIERGFVRYGENKFYDRIFYTDKSIFDIFSFPMINGDPESALAAANTAVITEDMARKYFKNKDPIGKVLIIHDEFNNQDNFTVTGIIKNVPENSHFTFDILCSFETIFANPPGYYRKWERLLFYTYILLQKNYDHKVLEKKFTALIDANISTNLKNMGVTLELYLQPLTSIHLNSHLQEEISVNGNKSYIYIFSVIAIFILLIACINFMNLSTACALIRAKEIGVRKVIGADRSKLIMQFFSESLFYSFLTFIIALILVILFFPVISSLSGKMISFSSVYSFRLIPGFLGLIIFVGLIAGSYPAFVLSSFQPIKAVKGGLSSNIRSSRLRNILVVFQFAVTIIFILGTVVVLKQLSYMKKRSLGFNKEHVIVFPFWSSNLIKNELRTLPSVINVGSSSHVPGEGTYRNPYIPEGYDNDQKQWMNELYIDRDFINVMGIDIVEGRNFLHESTSDVNGSCIINETAVKKFGWDNPVGKTIREITESGSYPERKVIGVVKDFHTVSLHKLIEPLIMIFNPGMLKTFAVKIRSGNIKETLNSLRNKWKEIYPYRPIEYHFLDESFDSQYKSDERLSKIYTYFTIIAVFVACIGLFGLVSFVADRRVKEIGIRKALGATVMNIVRMLSREFLLLVFFANIIAWPIAFFIMKKWLQNFAYRTDFGLWIFVLSGLTALAIALLTVSYQSVKAARANPVDSIRYE